MKLTLKTWSLIGLFVEFAAFLHCLGEHIYLQFYAPARISLMRPAMPYLLGAFAALVYFIASLVLHKKGHFKASIILAGAMVVVLLALKLAYVL
jgi:hypothetical protein